MASSKPEDLFKTQEESDDKNEIRNDTKIKYGPVLIQSMLIEKIIVDETYNLAKSLDQCEQIDLAANELSQYIPDLSNGQHSVFWEQKLIPNIVESLLQNARVRSIIVEAFASVCNLSIVIKTAGEIFKQTKGSSKAIEIAQNDIPNAFQKLENCIQNVSKLRDSAVNTFGSQAVELFGIIGPEAADFFNQKLKVESQMNEYYNKQVNLYVKLAEIQGEVSHFSSLISAIENNLKSATIEPEASKSRTEELQNLNVANLNAKKEYFYSNIVVRMERKRGDQKDKAEKQKVKSDLEGYLSHYKSKYVKAKAEFDKQNETFDNRMKFFQTQIDFLSKQLEEIDKREIDIQNITGLQGKTLINCLVAVRKLSKAIKGRTPYEPLIAILESLKNMVQSDIHLLSSPNPFDIFYAVKMLLAQIQFYPDFPLF